MKKTKIILISSLSILLLAIFLGLLLTGINIGWGPFKGLFWNHEVKRITNEYEYENNQGGIVFYGASNFRLWEELDEDLSDYNVVNSGFGGSYDELMVKYADNLLYKYNPNIVFFQTGSNDYVVINGSDEEKISKCMEYKKQMFETFHEKLPNAKFVVMSGLLLPGRSEYLDLTLKINEELKEYCDKYDYMYYVDANKLTYDGKTFNSDLFEKDGIHLNHKGQLKWRDDYILPIIEQLLSQYDYLNIVRKDK